MNFNVGPGSPALCRGVMFVPGALAFGNALLEVCNLRFALFRAVDLALVRTADECPAFISLSFFGQAGREA
jgi:hypothetical protein